MTIEINHNLLYLLSMANRFAERKVNDILTPYNIKSGQVIALFLLYENPGLTQKDICDLTGIEQPTIANTLKRMERDALIIRKSDKTDKRMIRNYLSADVAEKMPEIYAVMQKAEDKIMGAIENTKQDMIKYDLLHITKTLDPEWRFVTRWGSDLLDKKE
ncbi:MAG: MarR family winged helix-turn-helix transcriptional regulator [Alphaproteobacteria bacterium]